MHYAKDHQELKELMDEPGATESDHQTRVFTKRQIKMEGSFPQQQNSLTPTAGSSPTAVAFNIEQLQPLIFQDSHQENSSHSPLCVPRR